MRSMGAQVLGVCAVFAALHARGGGCPPSAFAGFAGGSGAASRSRTALSALQKPGSTAKDPFRSRVPMIFPTGYVSNTSTPRSLAGFVTGAFTNDTSARVVDFVQYSSAPEGALLYALAIISPDLNIAAQILPRQRDSRFRLRIIRDCKVEEDFDAEAFTISSTTNHTLLARTLRQRLRPPFERASNAKSTVKVQLIGPAAAANAMKILEELYWLSRREITFTAAYSNRTRLEQSANIAAPVREERPQLVVSVSSS